MAERGPGHTCVLPPARQNLSQQLALLQPEEEPYSGTRGLATTFFLGKAPDQITSGPPWDRVLNAMVTIGQCPDTWLKRWCPSRQDVTAQLLGLSNEAQHRRAQKTTAATEAFSMLQIP